MGCGDADEDQVRADHSAIAGGVPGLFDSLPRHLDRRFDALEKRISTMAMTMQDLDNALTAWETENDAAIAEVAAAVQAILAKVPPGVDTTAEVARLQAGMTKQQAAADSIKALDTTPPPGPTPTP